VLLLDEPAWYTGCRGEETGHDVPASRFDCSPWDNQSREFPMSTACLITVAGIAARWHVAAEADPRRELFEIFVQARTYRGDWWRDRERGEDARADTATPEKLHEISQQSAAKWQGRRSPLDDGTFRAVLEKAYPHTKRSSPSVPRTGESTEEQIERLKRELGEDAVVIRRNSKGAASVTLTRFRPPTPDEAAIGKAKAYAKTAFDRGREAPSHEVIERFLQVGEQWPDRDSASQALYEATTLWHLRSVRAHDKDAPNQRRQLFRRILDERPNVITEWSIRARLEYATSAPSIKDQVDGMIAFYDWAMQMSDQELYEKALLPMIESRQYTSAEIERRLSSVLSFLGMSMCAAATNACDQLGWGWYPEPEKLAEELIDKYSGQRIAQRAEVALEKLRAKKAAAATQPVRKVGAQCPPATQPACKESRAAAETAAPSDDSLRSYEVDLEKNRVKELTPKP
jgi:hypothetical protein